MKKIVVLLIMLFAMAFTANAGALAAFTNYGPISWEAVDTAYNIYPRDSLKNADTIILFNKYTYTAGYLYAVQIYDSIGAVDTVIIDQIPYATSSYNGKTVQISNPIICDTILPNAVSTVYRYTACTIGNPYPCNRFTIRAWHWRTNIAYLRRAELWRGKFSK
jgi:hypothetical protein